MTSAAGQVEREVVEPMEPGVDAWILVPKRSGRILDDLGVFLNGITIEIGRNDADTGPVDVDVSAWPGGETTSRRHARLEFVGFGWELSDLGSRNGVFVRSRGQERFSARVVEPKIVEAGDEIGLGSLICVLEGPSAGDEGAEAPADESAAESVAAAAGTHAEAATTPVPAEQTTELEQQETSNQWNEKI